jgi:putative ABC transport system permease protein
MNLVTAKSSQRAKEIGIRKVVGSTRFQLIRQFFTESILLSFIALFIALILVEIFLPGFNNLVNKEIKIGTTKNFLLILICLSITLIVGITSGSYPGIFLSSFQPVQIIKGEKKTGLSASNPRKILVIFQFVVAVALITSSIIIKIQFNYISNKKLGFNKENIVIVPIHDKSLKLKYKSFKNELLKFPGIISVSASNGTPFTGGLFYEKFGGAFQVKLVDHDFVKTTELEIIEGRDFNKEFGSDSMAVILNETAVKLEGLKDPVGKLYGGGISKKAGDELVHSIPIIGIVKDFHNKSLYEKIDPMVFQVYPSFFNQFLVRVRSDNISAALNHIGDQSKKFVPHQPFEYSFMDKTYEKLYHSDKRFGKILNYFTFLAIFISCLGLFGLVSYTSDQRTKEISIRKVFGASIQDIILLLSREFMILVMIAVVIAWPIAYYAMNKWLQNFAYHIPLKIQIFLLSALTAGILTLITLGYQAVRAARANPVDSLRSE